MIPFLHNHGRLQTLGGAREVAPLPTMHKAIVFVQIQGNDALTMFLRYASGSTGKPECIMMEHHLISRAALSGFVDSRKHPGPKSVWANLSGNAWAFPSRKFLHHFRKALLLSLSHEDVFLTCHKRCLHSPLVDVALTVSALAQELLREHPATLTALSMLR